MGSNGISRRGNRSARGAGSKLPHGVEGWINNLLRSFDWKGDSAAEEVEEGAENDVILMPIWFRIKQIKHTDKTDLD